MPTTITTADPTEVGHIVPAPDSAEEPETQLTIALRRILAEGCAADPQSAAAPFNSAF